MTPEAHQQAEEPEQPGRDQGKLKLHLGCGRDQREGWHNVDMFEVEGVDEVHDLDDHPWPWEDDAASEVFLKSVLEHLKEPIKALRELHRVTAPGGKITIIVPHRKSPAAYRPGHRSFWDEHSLTGWYEPNEADQRNPESDALFVLEEKNVYHRHPLAWHQRKYLGRELIGWGPQKVEFIFRNRPVPDDQA